MRKILTPWFLVLGAIISAQAMATEVVVLDELILGESTFTDVESFSQDHHCLLQKTRHPRARCRYLQQDLFKSNSI